jgi:hypothetical protein
VESKETAKGERTISLIKSFGLSSGLVKLKIPQSGGGLHSGRRLWYDIIERKLGTSPCGLLEYVFRLITTLSHRVCVVL